MPGKEYYREKLLKNIKAIQKLCPDFTMTEQQIDEILSDDRIRMHEKMRDYQPPHKGALLEQKIATIRKYTPMSDLNSIHIGSFRRNYFHVAREEKTQDDIDYNRRIFTNFTRDDELGEAVRNNYVVECMNSVFRIDLNKFKPDVPLEELLDYTTENSDLGGIAMENEHMLRENAYIKMKDEKRAHDVCQFGDSIGGYIREFPRHVQAESFLTFPIEYLNDDQYKQVVDSLNIQNDANIETETGLDNLIDVVSFERFRKNLPNELAQFEKEYKNKKPFSVDDIEFKEPDKNKRIGGGYLMRKNAALEGIEYLLYANYPVKSEKIDDMKAALVNVRAMLAEEKYLNDENEIDALTKEVAKVRSAANAFRKIPQIAGSNNPAVKELVRIAMAETKTLNPFSNSDSMKDQLAYYKEDRERLLRTNELLRQLNEMMTPFNRINEHGEKETLSSGDIYELRTKMSEVLQSVQTIADQKTVLSLKENVQKQLKSMDRAVPGMTLDTVLAGRGRTLDMTGHKFKTVGNVMSSRMMMTITGEDGSRQKGFFTKKTEFDIERFKSELKEKLQSKYPGNAELINSSVDFYSTDPGNRRREEFVDAHKNLSKNAEKIMSECSKTTDDYLADKGKSLGMLMNMDDKARIDSRNVAMSDVAILIGAEDVIAKSTPMVLYDNGVEVDGTFMETAHGEDIAHLHKNSPFMTVKADCLDYSPALRQLADMQVLDYICGNIDRHAGNIFYQFDENGKIKGVTGIDNDASFARGTRLSNRVFTEIDAMKAVSKSMAERLTEVTPEMLRASLAGNELVEEDISSAVDRLELMKKALSEGKIQIMDDDEFAKHRLDEFLVGDKVNTYKLVQEKINEVIEMKPSDRKLIEQGPDKKAVQEPALDFFEAMDTTQLVQDIEPVDAKLRQLEEAEESVFFGSTEFDNVKQSLRRINDANRLISENGRVPSKRNYEMIQAAYKKAARDCQMYIARKEKQGIIRDGVLMADEMSKPGKRIAAVKSVLEFCNNKVRSLENSINPYHIDRTRSKAEKDKNRILSRGMIDGLDPMLAGSIVKDMNALSSNENASTKERIFAANQVKTVYTYMQENNIKPAECGLNKQDLQNMQNTIKVGREAYETEHPELAQEARDIEIPAIQV